MADNIDEQAFSAAVQAIGDAFSTAFAHGLLSAYCCERSASYGWAKALVEQMNPDDAQQVTHLRYLDQVKATIAAQLENSDLTFHLILDNTTESLRDEVLLTRDWASGYWLGIKQLSLADTLHDDELSSEFLSDLPQVIALSPPEHDDTAEDLEQEEEDDARVDIMEIQEYCRAGAISVFLASQRVEVENETESC